MAKQFITSLVDDIDGSPAHETIRFALDGVSYEIDLNTTNAALLRSSLAEYVEAARKTPAIRSRGRLRGSAPTTAAVRAWARQQGILVNGRGTIQADVMAKYVAAH